MNFEELTGGDLALVTGGSCLNDKVKFNRMGRELISYIAITVLYFFRLLLLI